MQYYSTQNKSLKINNSMKIFPKLNFSILFFIVFALSTFNLTAQVNGVDKDKARRNTAIILQKPINDSRIQNRKHERVSSIAASEDGKHIYLVWYSGGRGEGPGNYVTLSVSTNGGKDWKNDELVVFPKDSTTRFFDPVLWRDHFGKIWLFYAVSMNNKYWDLKGGVNAMPIVWDGSKVVWEKPKLISYGLMMNKPFYISEKENALFPVSLWQLRKGISKDPEYIPDGTFIYSHSYKKNKKLSHLKEYSSINTLPDSMRTVDEHQLVQVNGSGGFLCLLRTKKGIYYSKSRDYGKSWTVLQPFTSTGATPPSRFYIGKLRSGNLLLILNDSKTRTNMTAFVSKDGGETWPHKLLLDNRNQVSYPDADQDENGIIHITYDRDRNRDKEINYCRITEKDILEGNEKAIFKMRINK